MKVLTENIIASLLLLFLILTISSCGKTDIVSPGAGSFDNFSYPSATGNYWFYSYKNFSFNCTPDSVKNYVRTDTLEGDGISKFTGDTVINGISCKIYKSEHAGGIHGHHETVEYFLNTDTGLVQFAQKSTGNSFGPFSPNPGAHTHYKVNNLSFTSIPAIFNYFRSNLTGGDTLFVLNPPANCIEYPVTAPGSEWYFTKISGFFDVKKMYTGFESIMTPAGNFNCAVIKKNFYYPSGLPESNYVFYDYLSPAGMVKREYTIKNIGAYNNNGELVGYFDAREEAVLTTYNIQ